METQELAKIQQTINTLVQKGKINAELAEVLTAHIKVSESLSVKVSKLIQEVATLINDNQFFSDAISSLQQAISKLHL